MRRGHRRVLLWDVMSTLVRDPFYEDVPRFFGTSLPELVAIKDPHAWPAFERGHIDGAQLCERFFLDRRPVDGPGLRATMSDGYAWLPGVEEIVAELADAGVEMHALSNYPRWFELIEERLSPSRYLAWTFVSCKTGLRKPEAAAYRHAVSALGVRPADATFVDDRDDNCAAAQACGLKAVRFEDASRLRRALFRDGWPLRPG